jgi:hypothetical protein
VPNSSSGSYGEVISERSPSDLGRDPPDAIPDVGHLASQVVLPEVAAQPAGSAPVRGPH